MFRAALLVALLAPPEPVCRQPVERVFLGAVVTNPTYYGRLVEVCGTVFGVNERNPQERMIHDASSYADYAMFIFEGDALLPSHGRRTCITGRFLRRDGLSPAEAQARGLPDTQLPEGLNRPDYVFYPARCGCDGRRAAE